MVFRVFSAVFLWFSRVFTGVERGKKSLVFWVVFLAWWTFRIFFFFFSARVRDGEGGVRGAGEGGAGFLLKIPSGGVSRTGGAEEPGGCLRRIGDFRGGGG